MSRAPGLVLAVLCSCGSPTPTPADAGCLATFTGNHAGTASAATCAALSTAPDAGSDQLLALTFPAAGADGVQLEVQIDLGESPGAGDLSSETVSDWSALGLAASNNCAYSAGKQSAPPGNFTMTLSAVTATDAHGTLQLEQYVHAPPAVDCGAGDTETVEIRF